MNRSTLNLATVTIDDNFNKSKCVFIVSPRGYNTESSQFFMSKFIFIKLYIG